MRRLTGAVLFCAVLVFSPSIFAVNLQVTPTAASCSDCDPTNDCSGTCLGDPGVPCPFQEALNIAQCNFVDDTITLAAGSYDPSLITTADTECGDDGFCYDALVNGESANLTIIGAGKGLTFIDGGGQNVTGLSIDPLGETDGGLNLIIRGITFQNNGPTSGSDSGGLLVFMQNATVTIEDNEFINNGGEQSGGGGGASLTANGAGDIIVNRNAFFDNQALSGVRGGGISVTVVNGLFVLTNNIFAGNLADDNVGGGLALDAEGDAAVRIVHNTFFNNTAAVGGGIHLELCTTNTVDIYNNIIYQNIAPAGGEDIAVIAGGGGECQPDGIINLFNNDLINREILPATITLNEGSNLNIDPAWVNSGADDFHLTAVSQVIDTGELNPPGSLPTPDFDLVTRPQGPLPDMGALEFIPPACGDGNVDVGEQCDPQNSVTPCPTGLTCDPTSCQCTGCGDGVVTPPEECDPPNTATCDATCQLIAVCGNGILEAGEECDDGNLDNNDACSSLCLILCVAQGSGCGDSGPNVCANNGGLGLGEGASLIPAGLPSGVMIQWLAAFTIPGGVFTALKLRRRKK